VKYFSVLISISILILISSSPGVRAQNDNLDISLNMEPGYQHVYGNTTNQTVRFNGTINITKLPAIPATGHISGYSISKEWPFEVTPENFYFIDETPQQFVVSITVPGGWVNEYVFCTVSVTAMYLQISKTAVTNTTGFEFSVATALGTVHPNPINTTNLTQPNATQPSGIHNATSATMIDDLRTIIMNPITTASVIILIAVVVTASYAIRKRRKARAV